MRDIVGLYLNPPDAALVLCVDEKSQIQALDRTAPILPLLPGVPARQTHDYRRFGVTNLYAALNLASGQVIADLTPRHRTQEFIKFLRLIDREVPKELEVHVVVDNSSTHKTPAVKRWLLAHPRLVFHFTPTYSSSDEPGRALVRRAHHQVDQARHPPFGQGTHRIHPHLDRLLERASPALCLAQDRRSDPGRVG